MGAKCWCTSRSAVPETLHAFIPNLDTDNHHETTINNNNKRPHDATSELRRASGELL